MNIVVKINKAVVGSGHRDAPKYMGEGVALCRHPVLWLYHGCGALVLWLFLGNFSWVHFGHGMFKACHLICQCYIVKQHCDIKCDVTVQHVHWSHDLLL